MLLTRMSWAERYSLRISVARNTDHSAWFCNFSGRHTGLICEMSSCKASSSLEPPSACPYASASAAIPAIRITVYLSSTVACRLPRCSCSSSSRSQNCTPAWPGMPANRAPKGLITYARMGHPRRYAIKKWAASCRMTRCRYGPFSRRPASSDNAPEKASLSMTAKLSKKVTKGRRFGLMATLRAYRSSPDSRTSPAKAVIAIWSNGR
mmetsp:Transcript_13634/g.22492  ORF Transcript_13634/g.22492 Transcript_13634/m.22492 type:complete len:208 (-) Transcript_13634:70-693(-)